MKKAYRLTRIAKWWYSRFVFGGKAHLLSEREMNEFVLWYGFFRKFYAGYNVTTVIGMHKAVLKVREPKDGLLVKVFDIRSQTFVVADGKKTATYFSNCENSIYRLIDE